MAFNPLYSTSVVGGNFFPIAYGVRLTNQAVYNSLFPFGFYGPFGHPLIGGVSPNDMAAYCGIPVVHNGSYAQQIAVPNVNVGDSPIIAGGPFAPLDQGSGTYAGQNWLWMASIEFYVGGALPGVPVVNLATGVYAGNAGTVTVNVGFDLTAPNSGVIICADGGGHSGGFRSNLMGGTAPLPGGSSGSGVANAIALTATGFTAGTGNGLVNAAATNFSWFAFSNPDGTYIQTGHYVGSGATDSSGSSGLVNGTAQQTIAGAGAGDVGNSVDVYLLGTNTYVTTVTIVGFDVPSGKCNIGLPWQFGTATYTTIIHRAPLVVAVPFAIAAVPSDIWIFGIGGSCPTVYKGSTFPAGLSVWLAKSAFNSKIEIISTGSNKFSVGSGFSNTSSQDRYFVAFSTGGNSPIPQFFRDGTYTGAPGGTIAGLPFAPAFAISQQIIDTTTNNGIWRAAGLQAGTDSAGFSTNPNSGNVDDYATGGLTALTSDGFTEGSTAAGNGNLTGWYALKNGSVTGNNSGPLSCNCPGNSTPGFIGTGYQIQLTASGGTAPYRFELVNGSLPNGLVLDPNTGVITGVPSVVGTFLFSYRVTDGNLANSNDVTIASCSITITTPNTNNPTLPAVPPSSGSPTSGCINTQSPGADSGGVAGCISTM